MAFCLTAFSFGSVSLSGSDQGPDGKDVGLSAGVGQLAQSPGDARTSAPGCFASKPLFFSSTSIPPSSPNHPF